MLHEGTIPVSASRMTISDIIMSFGHGLRGLLPSIPGTMSLLSLWENSLEGHLNARHAVSGRHVIQDMNCSGRPVCARCESSGPMKYSKGWLASKCHVMPDIDIVLINAHVQGTAHDATRRLTCLDSL
eukprot:5817057-Amphidinium_carterae.1